MKVNTVPIGSSPRVRRGRTARFQRARKRKGRPAAELHWGYNYSRGHIPPVPGAGSVQLNLFEQPGGSASRFPKRRLATVLALAGAVILAAGFGLLLHPLGYAIGGSLLVFFVLRGFLRSSPRNTLELSTHDGAMRGERKHVSFMNA